MRRPGVNAQLEPHASDRVRGEGVVGGDLPAAPLVVLAVQQYAVVQLGVVGGDESALPADSGLGPFRLKAAARPKEPTG